MTTPASASSPSTSGPAATPSGTPCSCCAALLCGDGHRADDHAQVAFVALHRHWRRLRDRGVLDAGARRTHVRRGLATLRPVSGGTLDDLRPTGREEARMDDGTDGERLTAPSGFDHARVVSAARRATARRRSVIAGGVLAVLAVAGVGVAVAAPSGARATAADAAGAESGVGGPARRATVPPPPAVPPPPPPPAPLGPADTDGCVDKQDPALRALVNEVLPEVRPATEAPTTMECRPGGGREVNLEVVDGATTGLLSAEYAPPGAPSPAYSLPDPEVAAQARPTASGGTLTITSRAAEPAAGPAPFAARLGQVADRLAPRL